MYASSYEYVARSTATIVHDTGIGSGFFISNSLLVTNYHVVQGASKGIVLFVTQTGIKDIGIVIATDPKNDLAVVKTLQSNYKGLKLGENKTLKMGDDILVIGSPLGALSKGILSAKRNELLQFTASISSSSSGSPVFSKDFKVVGIVKSSYKKGRNLNFAISVSKLKKLIRRAVTSKEINNIKLKKASTQSINNFNKKLSSYKKSKNKTPENMFYLGKMYYIGKGVTQDYKKAAFWYEKAANKGYAEAQFNLGEIYSYGLLGGVTIGSKKAFYWHQKAANLGYRKAQKKLGWMYYRGKESWSTIWVSKDYKKALYWYKKAANQGNVEAQGFVAEIYLEGHGTPKNYKKAIYWLKKSANGGDAHSINKLGDIYYDGIGVPKNYKTALYWYKKSYGQINVLDVASSIGFMTQSSEVLQDSSILKSLYKIGEIYYYGDYGLSRNFKKAFYWYEKAANNGFANAQYNLALMYKKGEGVLRDYKKALYWYRKAANSGLAEAQSNLALMYDEGKGVLRDYKKALYWYRKAANNGLAEAQFNLALMYKKGEGVLRDYKKALYWYTKAANNGDAEAQFNLSLMYYKGEGVLKDYVIAYKWAILAKAQENEQGNVSKLVSSLEGVMTRSQIMKSLSLAKEFQSKKEVQRDITSQE